MSSDINEVVMMLLTKFLVNFYFFFVLIGLSEYFASKFSLLEKRFAMYKMINKKMEFEDIENRRVFPTMKLHQI